VKFLELRIPPAIVLLTFGLAIWVVSRLIPAARLPRRLGVPIGIALAAAGVLIAIAGAREFRRAHTTVNPLKPDTASTLVTSGIFRFTRNPMYLGLLLVLTGWAVGVGHPFAAALVPVFLLYIGRLQIAPEERAIGSKFGAEFDAYRRSVRRWI
jgi:protein-S-isoprenylcysteine O-methyltransferase Ste14